MFCVGEFSFSVFVEILLIIPTVLFSFKLVNTHDPPDFEAIVGINSSAISNNGIFFGLVTGDIMSSVHRRRFQYTNWLQYLKYFEFGYSYIIEGHPNIPYNHSTIVPKFIIKYDKNSERAAKKLSAAYYFYYNTSYKWLWISNDDVSVSITRLRKLVNQLNILYDTNKETVVLGGCVGHMKPFIQGGSGMILSRKAAYKFTEFGVKWIKEKVVWADDVEFNEFIWDIGESPASCNIPHMVGHPLDYVLPINMKTMPECGDIENTPNACFRKPQSADDIVAIHLNRFPHGWDQILELEKHTGEGLMWYNIQHKSKLCKVKLSELPPKPTLPTNITTANNSDIRVNTTVPTNNTVQIKTNISLENSNNATISNSSNLLVNTSLPTSNSTQNIFNISLINSTKRDPIVLTNSTETNSSNVLVNSTLPTSNSTHFNFNSSLTNTTNMTVTNSSSSYVNTTLPDRNSTHINSNISLTNSTKEDSVVLTNSTNVYNSSLIVNTTLPTTNSAQKKINSSLTNLSNMTVANSSSLSVNTSMPANNATDISLINSTKKDPIVLTNATRVSNSSVLVNITFPTQNSSLNSIKINLTNPSNMTVANTSSLLSNTTSPTGNSTPIKFKNKVTNSTKPKRPALVTRTKSSMKKRHNSNKSHSLTHSSKKNSHFTKSKPS
ncbi:hypothetical protein TVAG_228090 [Trichomonas vaginalis G3]|uniref:Uncharacterized protein n=1 Tax=Trichomonas vaginalis (strain ATCC PRA-98 / G3) TaxID=412133 RepID=A2FW17_TRIV3|nr:hypothetical protein TVAGG3_0699600 [Trichomonas vaginalis G3]EAX90908.1 hypothetical protein TVAG_228090 [Trichomonas vaginalis G3]KAI5509149.1 hypothetical protein TVAGG3_0699600 [Trichomonas vaginalis G3]|eukprot:XP_001303838.1 hypothetical protein [Trichomonas vaginalis G3]